MDLTISIGILTASRNDLLRSLLESLLQQVEPGDEILVLDTAGSHSTEELIAEFNSAQISYRTFVMEQFNFASARNELLKMAKSDALAFIDDDALPFSDWLSNLRRNLKQYPAIGGPTVSNGPLPRWWHSGINWCIGLSPPGSVLNMPGYYPDTCNTAARQSLWTKHPFHVIERENGELYGTGREDAEWWLDRRLNGTPIIINYRQAVSHLVHQDRLTLDYIKRRARLDGQASWNRRPLFEKATAIPWDTAHIAGVVADHYVRYPLDRRRRMPHLIWLHRQWGLFTAVWHSPAAIRPPHFEMIRQLGSAAAFQARIRMGQMAFSIIKRIRSRRSFPPAIPRKIFISADCHLGDTLILRRHIQAVAQTFPNSAVLVSAKFPALLSGMPDNVIVKNKGAAAAEVNNSPGEISAAIVPYFPFGESELWRKHLSSVGTTFDCDVGFGGRRDAIYARRVITKNLELHEHENLARLFQIWPLNPVSRLAPALPDSSSLTWLSEITKSRGMKNGYVVVQFGAGYPAKEWPLDCWIPFLQEFVKEIEQPIIITGGDEWTCAADTALREINIPDRLFNFAGSTDVDQLMALIHGSSFLIGGCSGPKHIAMMYKVPTFTLYSATEPQRWGATEDHHLHAYVNALPQKLTGIELQGLNDDFRPRLLNPAEVARAALHHYRTIMRREKPAFSSDSPFA